MAKHKLSLKERFESKYIPDPTSGCWLWSAYIGPEGYGRIGAHGLPSKYAHRIAWELHFGHIPEGMFVCHKCDVRSCVNPDHLFLGTNADNIRDMVSKGRKCVLRGSQASWAKLSERDVYEIRASGEAAGFLASRFGVSAVTIYEIKTFRKWRHLPPQPAAPAKTNGDIE